jgi:nucleotide-binding universal stress UspA family protein
MLCAVDLGPQSLSVARWARDLAGAYGAELHLLHVTPSGPRETWRREAAQAAEEQMRELLRELGARAELQVLPGKVPGCVVDMARSVEAGLIVIGRGCGDGGGRLPGQAYAVIRDAPCPVFSV